jgi:hypothetical protein
MIGYILTETEKENIDGKFYTNAQFFHCSKDVDGVWYVLLSSDDKAIIKDTDYSWILNCSQGEYVQPPLPI